MHEPILLLHIFTAVVGLLSGFLAMFLRKGSGWHGAAGSIFFGSMVCMTVSAAYIAAFWKINMLNLTVSLLTFYLVVTAWRTAKRRIGAPDVYDLIALLFVMAVGIAGIKFGVEAAGSIKGTKNGMPAPMYFVFGSIALLHGVSDIRMFLRGGVTGARRIARHLWRMSFALLIATMSFYPGQARQFPKWLRDTNVFFVPHILLIGAMLFWILRMRRLRKQQERVLVADQEKAVVTKPVGTSVLA